MAPFDLSRPWALPADQLGALHELNTAAQSGQWAAVAQNFPAADPEARRERSVAVLTVTGVLMHRPGPVARLLGGVDSRKARDMIAATAADDGIEAVALVLDSPGGEVTGTAALADAVRTLAETKPTTAIVQGTCASAALWVASQAGRIVATEDSAQVGSIGVVATHVDRSQRDAAAGFSVTHIVAGRYKAATTAHAPLGEDGRDMLQAQCDDLYHMFVQAVAHGRGTTPMAVHDRWGDGRVFLAAEAARTGLIDGIEPIEAAIESLVKGEGPAIRKKGSNMQTTITGGYRAATTPAEKAEAARRFAAESGTTFAKAFATLFEKGATDERVQKAKEYAVRHGCTFAAACMALGIEPGRQTAG